jgi:A/G-specific adenine glycosylase
MFKKDFAKKIIEWYREYKRNLPWRETKDPYKIWLAEIILQQTRVAQGFPYYLKFIEHFPDVFALASAREEEVLRLWQGLGYYSRARNLHRTAKEVAHTHKGVFPDNFIDLQKLPGVGSYTAAAIASICFLEPVPVIDGNVYRVLARVFGIELDIAAHQSKEYFFWKASELISKDHPDEFNQAIMDFGATHCTPRNPACEECIFKRSCVAFARDLQNKLPVKTKKPKSRKRYFYYFVLKQGRKLAMRKREGKDIWRALYDFQLEETRRPQKSSAIVARHPVLKKILKSIEIGEPSSGYKHILSHQTLRVVFIPIRLKSVANPPLVFNGKALKFYSSKEIEKIPKPVLVSQYLSDTGFL